MLTWWTVIKRNVAEIKKIKFENLKKKGLTYIPRVKKVCEIENFEEFVDLNLQEKVTRIPDVNDFHQNALHFFKEMGNHRF